jgi:hypothetical protein
MIAVERTTRSILRGVVAGTFGTVAFDVWLYRAYRNDGGKEAFGGWESSEGVTNWDDAPAPALVAKRLLEPGLGHEIPPRYARLLNNATHWGFGLANGAAYGLLLGSRRRPKVWFGLPFGAAVWAAGYVVLPQFGVYKQIWEYDLQTLGKDLSAHLVYGASTAAAFSLLDGTVQRGED